MTADDKTAGYDALRGELSELLKEERSQDRLAKALLAPDPARSREAVELTRSIADILVTACPNADANTYTSALADAGGPCRRRSVVGNAVRRHALIKRGASACEIRVPPRWLTVSKRPHATDALAALGKILKIPILGFLAGLMCCGAAAAEVANFRLLKLVASTPRSTRLPANEIRAPVRTHSAWTSHAISVISAVCSCLVLMVFLEREPYRKRCVC